MLALGYPVTRYRLIAYVISGALCSISGVLLANLNEFASSQYMHWIVSGDLIIMIIMGGLRSIAGPIIGAIAFIALQEILSAYTDRWQVFLGPLLVLLVMYGRDGIVGMAANARAKLGKRRA
jgi:branched-chain amino acid transport system permease protein